jgi:molybdate transport system substrate-binding protein
MASRSLSIALAVALTLLAGASTEAAEIKVLSANGAKLILETLVPQFESETNNKVTTSYGEGGVLRKRILDGEAFDVTFLPAGWGEIDDKIDGDPIAIANTELGMAVLVDAPTPDTSSSDALKETLLSAKSIVYTDPKTGGIDGVLFARMIERLGIADEVNRRSKLVDGALNATFLLRGEADLAVQLANEILAVPGVQFVPMPPQFRISVTFSGAVGTSATDSAAAKSLIHFLARPAVAPVIRSMGYEPG